MTAIIELTAVLVAGLGLYVGFVTWVCQLIGRRADELDDRLS